MFNDDMPDEVRTALGDLNEYRDHLIGLAASSVVYIKLKMPLNEEITEENTEMKDLLSNQVLMEKAQRKIAHSVEQLTNYISKLPYPSEQEHALNELWTAISYSFVIGSRAVRNPVAESLKKMEKGDQLAGARETAAEIRGDHLVTEVVEQAAVARWAIHPEEAGRPFITAKGIEVVVNEALASLHKEGRVQFSKLERDTISGKVKRFIERKRA